MMLVDTSVWIDHLHKSEPALELALRDDQVAVHPFVIGELCLGSIADRDALLTLLSQLRPAPVLTQQEFLSFVGEARLWGRGLSLVDVHLLGSVRLMPGWQLWTNDKRLQSGAQVVSVKLFGGSHDSD